MLVKKPGLQFVPAQHLARQQIVRAGISGFLRPFRGRAYSLITASWASNNREIWTGTSSRPRGGRARLVISATSAAMATLMPPSN